MRLVTLSNLMDGKRMNINRGVKSARFWIFALALLGGNR